MTVVLAHGALGVWDEVVSVALLIGGPVAGVGFALWGRFGSRDPPLPAEEPVATGQPLVKQLKPPPGRRSGAPGRGGPLLHNKP